MGPPVSVVVANMVMEDVEQRTLNSFDVQLPLWKRYVDDTFTIVRWDMLTDLHRHLHGAEPSIQFTIEIEKEGTLPFADVRVTRDQDGNLDTSIYRKPTHTDQHLHVSSNHFKKNERSAVQTLLNRAITHSSSIYSHHSGGREKGYNCSKA